MVEMDDQDVVREFLIESNENLARLDNEIVELERRPKDADLLASIFRTFHTIKGTCGFLGFTALEAITHEAETILSQLRSGERELSGSITSLMLEVVDATRSILAFIEKDGQEGPNGHLDLRKRLKQAADAVEAAAAATGGGTAPPANGEPGNGDAELRLSAADSAIRVDVGLLDKLMNLVGELVLARNQILQHTTQNEDGSLNATSQRLNLITTELQEGVMKTRMQPIGVVWNKLPRVVRDISYSLGKQIRLEMDGAETELDKTIIEAIKDPLTHLVRNSCDHGIERPEARVQAGKPAQGKVLLRAYHEGGQVNIEICDDGAGIDIARLKKKAVAKGVLRAEQAERIGDREALNLIFHPGLSTADSVTNVSGRGVGMDVVQSNIEKIGGLVDVSSRVGEGTTVRLKIPLTLAIIPGLVVTSGGERFVIPQVSLLELIRLEGDAGGKQIERVHGTPVYRRRGSLLPIAHLNEVLRLRGPRSTEAVSIVVLQGEDRQFGLVVDGISDTQEIVVKPLGKQLKGLTTYAGATIMGDGKVALILDVVGIGQRSGVLAAAAEQSRADARQKGQAASDAQRLLLFRAGSFERIAVPLSLVARLEEFHQTGIEHAGGHRVVQYRDRILPLVSLTTILEPGAADTAAAQDPVQAIVFKDGDHSIGIVVDKVLDIIEDEVVIRQQTAHRGLLGSAVVGKRVADFLDLHAVLKAVAGDWFRRRPAGRHPATVLLAEASPFARGLLRGGLEMAGHRVIEASNAPEVLTILDRGGADVLVASLDLPPEGGFALLEAVRRRSGAKPLPALALTATAPETARPDREPAFEDYQPKFDCEAMVRSVERLAAAVADAGAVPAGIGESR
jgi:two-component system chemotaxis sensor kinase CheA